ncbi:DUF1007 family protein [Yoonia sp. 208BN28-4]|uniref:DUF1007 family protein n=1 Tax=Yoonia sp. 208BN28-4 TaxID=3126505 RepID=UPI0030B263C0
MRLLTIATAVSCLVPLATATAHPHLFVGVGVTVIFDDERPVGVQLDWSYDDFFSLVLTSDLGIDLDGDLVLTDAEVATLTDAVVNWPADFGGDLEVLQGGANVPLDERTNHIVTYENGLVTEAHTRPIGTLPDPSAPFTVRVYDPFYYVSYSLNGPVRFVGRDDCTATVLQPDLNAAYSEVDELLYGRPAADVGAEEDFPPVGILFAETITISCEG